MSYEKLEQQQAASQNDQWESISDVEFAGSKTAEAIQGPTHNVEKGDVEDNIAEIKAILDTRTIAEKKDSKGLAEAREKDQSILISCTTQRKELEEGVAEYRALSKEMDEFESSGKGGELTYAKAKREKSRIHKVLAFFRIPDKILDDINAELTRRENRFERLIELSYRGYSKSNEEIEARKKTIDDMERTASNEEEFLSGFEMPLSREQKDRLLDYGTLAELSTEEYLKLWRHLNPQYVSHVTRQGYRDHNKMIYHTDGLGEMSKGFTNTLKSGKALQSRISLDTGLSKSDLLDDEEAFRSYMEEVYFKRGIPKSLLESNDLSPNTIASAMSSHGVLGDPNGFWRDRTSIHVAGNNVLNGHYGAESGNEIFYIFPADVIMSQSSVNKSLVYDHEILIRIGEHKRGIPSAREEDNDHNDFSIYVQDGLPLDAGLVFLPKSVLVDPNTGSKYHSFNRETMNGVIMTEEMGGIPAEEYWENYFKEHPEEKPAHIIYYDGDPETAVAKTLARNGIYVGNHGDISSENGNDLGFSDKIAYGDTESNKQLNREAEKFFAKVADFIRLKKD